MWSGALWQIHISYNFSVCHRYLDSWLKKKKKEEGRKETMSIAVGRFDFFPPQICHRPSENQRAIFDHACPSYPTLNK